MSSSRYHEGPGRVAPSARSSGARRNQHDPYRVASVQDGSKWDYVFFVDIEGHAEDEAMCARRCKQVGSHASLFRVLGAYPKASALVCRHTGAINVVEKSGLIRGTPGTTGFCRPSGSSKWAVRWQVPGDKSISHRSRVVECRRQVEPAPSSGFLRGEDCLATLAALQAMGVEISSAERG